jgi:flagellar hook-length control protein FliK
MADAAIPVTGLLDTQAPVNTGITATAAAAGEGVSAPVSGVFAGLVLGMLEQIKTVSGEAEIPVMDGKILPSALPLDTGADAGPDTGDMATNELLAMIMGQMTTPNSRPAESPVVDDGVAAETTEVAEGNSAPMAQPVSTIARSVRAAVIAMTAATGKQEATAPAQAVTVERAIRHAAEEAALPAATERSVVAATSSEALPDASANELISPAALTPTPAPNTGAGKIPDSAPIPIQQRGFEQALGDRVVWLANNKIQSAEIQVNPPDLGPIEVRIQVNNDQASVSFGAAQPATREALESALPRLREMLSQQGLNLADANVSQHSSMQGRDEGGFGSPANPALPETTDGSVIPVARAAIGMVDVYV